MFRLLKTSNKSQARLGIIKTAHGNMATPFFMPDATRGFVRSLSQDDLVNIEMGPMVVNTYHLYLQPGLATIKKAGGIHKFMNWPKPLLSDSGGYQVFSLIHKDSKLGKITDREVIFKSPLDGSVHILTPEKAIQIQFDLGVDMMVCLDDPTPNSYTKKNIEQAVERTIRWAVRCKTEYNKQLKRRGITKNKRPLIFGVIQGGGHLDLRKYCTDQLVKIGFDGYGFGARHLDVEGNFMDKVVKETANYIPKESLRFALGVGTPDDILKCTKYGWDMFDCVIPTREARHGRLYLRNKAGFKNGFYKTINIDNARFKKDLAPINKTNLKDYSKAYLCHLFRTNEPLGLRLATLNNLDFYLNLMRDIKFAIQSEIL